ncbi:treslin isoform X2 [Pristis pectinata]|uniref:treslin isoform X2 n=1 Tax=Pristis pectinata TaxID=685728 RepID=UPI00223DDBD8|nr:treslin isoform X2 [Pristis pectinata]
MGSHNLAFLVDTAASEGGLSPALVRRAALRVLLHSACRAGFQDVRWAFKLFDSAAARGRVSRGHGFRELRLKHLEELEEALSRELGRSRRRGTAAATQTALIEALSDYPWDRPDITSPAKPGRGSAAEAPQPRPRNVLFLFAPCPLSRADLGSFLQLPAADSCHQLAEKIIPPPVRALLSGHSIALHWVDTQPLHQFIGTSDHVGYRLISEVMRLVGGSLIPFAALMKLSLKDSHLPLEKTSLSSQVGQKNGKDAKEYVEQLKTVDALFPFDCTMNYFVSIDSFYRNTFPLQHGLLTVTQGGQKVCCPIILEPISCTQKYLTDSVNIIVKGVMKNWDPKRTDLSTHSWVLQQAEQNKTKDNCLLQLLLQEMACNKLHVVADIEMNDCLAMCTGILSPLLCNTAVFTLIWERSVEFEELLLQAGITERSQEMSSELSDIVDKALNLISDTPKECLTSSDVTVPDWVHLELSETSNQSISFVEGWFPLSELSGASSTLMESFRSIQATDDKENLDSELALTGHLAEFYQRKSAGEAGASIEHGAKRRRCGPRTPIRQKMKSMSRSLQMLNVARLNVKAQKSQTDGVQPLSGEISTNQSKKHLGHKWKNKKVRKDIADFKSSEEMISSLKETYQKYVSEEELPQFNFIKNAITVIKMYLESANTEDLEVACINLIRMQLLKSSKSIRQQYGNQENKECKVRDCQLQVLLCLEMCQQFPSLQSDNEQLEQLVEEMTNLLRIISLTKDTTFLTAFLEEEILNTYLLTVPKILGELYFGLGQNVPARLASVLPADFFSDESMSQEAKSPGSSQPASLAPNSSCADFEGEQLGELRTRSCRKRRNFPMTRHRSTSEVSHNLRQIQMPKKSVKQQENVQSHLSLAIEQPKLLQSSSQKDVQEVTKVRRNLFNREMLSPRKKSKMLRSQSLSVDKGVRQLHSEEKTTKSNRKLLTKKVTETPLHKQVPQRLLHKQIQGRCSESNSDVSIVEESPEKALSNNLCLRRSPRIRKASLARRHSSTFYSGSRPMSRSLERVQSLSQKAKGAGNQAIQSPNRFLFGAVFGLESPKNKRIRSPSEGLLVKGPKSCPQQTLNSPDKTRAAQRSRPTHHYLTPRKKVKNAKIPSKNLNFAKNFLNKGSSPRKIATDSQFQSPRRSERLIKATIEEGNSPWKMEGQSLFKSPSTVSVQLKLTSPYKDHSPAKQSSRQSECLASPCTNLSTVEFGSQVKAPVKDVSVLSSSEIESKRPSPSCLIDTLSKDKPSKLCTSGKLKLRKSKSDELLISCTPAKSFVSPQKLWISESSKTTGGRGLDLSSPDKSNCSQSIPSTPSTSRNISKASPQTPLKTPVMTRSMWSLRTPTRFNESPGKTRVGYHATPSKSQLKTPSKSVTPPKSPAKTRSMFNRTPAKSQSKPPPKYSTRSPKSPIKTQSVFNVTPLKTEVTELSKCSATSPYLKSSRSRARAGLNAVFSKVDQKKPSNCNSTPDKSPVGTLSPSTSNSTSPYLKDTMRVRLGFNITESKHDVHDLSEAQAILDTSIKLVSEAEAITVPLKIPPEPATSVPRLNQVFKTPEKNMSTIYNAWNKSPKNVKVFGKSKASMYECMQQENIGIPNTTESCVTNQTASGSWLKVTCDNSHNLRADCFNAVGALDSSHSVSCLSQSTASELVLILEKPDSSPLASRIDSSATGLQTKENSDISQDCLSPKEGSGLRMKFAVQRNVSNSSVNFVAPTKSSLLQKESTSYEFRWTPDRRQRLAAAQQQQMLEVPRETSTPNVCNWPSMPTYEVELEMQDSGLPKLRFKRTNSSAGVSPKLKKSVSESNNSPLSGYLKRSGCESPLGEAQAQFCIKHSGRTEAGHISPSFCFHTSLSTPAKATPRKGGVQTYICQSYTPNQCSSNTSSPSQTDLGAVPWTPSPTHKLRPSQTPDAIKNWPRKKKAATTPLSRKSQKVGEPIVMQKDGNIPTEHYSSKTLPLEELSMEGVSRLQDQSPNVEWDQRFPDSPVTTFALHSRKRGSSFISPVATEGREVKKRKETNFTGTSSESGFTSVELQKRQSSPSSSAPIHETILHCSVDDDVFNSPVETSPSYKVKSGLSASGLLTLTQSPLLYTGRTPAKKRTGIKDIVPIDSSPSKRLAGDIEQDYSPFAKMPVRRCITKTYSRKKLAN